MSFGLIHYKLDKTDGIEYNLRKKKGNNHSNISISMFENLIGIYLKSCIDCTGFRLDPYKSNSCCDILDKYFVRLDKNP
jgi:hypothetical protein